MIEDPVIIRPESKQRNYYTDKFEFATPVSNPKEKARHFFEWGIIFHARGKPAEAYKYYEKAIIHHRFPLYLKQMGILHHEMGYYRDALRYLRSALDIEKEIKKEKELEEARQKQEATDYSVFFHSEFFADSTNNISYSYSAK